jgi:hypothetical protein
MLLALVNIKYYNKAIAIIYITLPESVTRFIVARRIALKHTRPDQS